MKFVEESLSMEREEVRSFVYASLGVGSTVLGRESHSMAVCCREMVAVVLHMFVPQKKFRVCICRTAELVSFKIRLDLSQSGSPPGTPYASQFVCLSLYVYWMWKLLICSAKINSSRTYLLSP